MMITPALGTAVLIKCLNVSLDNFTPVSSDEVGYYLQINTLVHHGFVGHVLASVRAAPAMTADIWPAWISPGGLLRRNRSPALRLALVMRPLGRHPTAFLINKLIGGEASVRSLFNQVYRNLQQRFLGDLSEYHMLVGFAAISHLSDCGPGWVREAKKHGYG
jgi:hypothetical protein